MQAIDLYQHWETDLRPFTVSALRQMTPEQLAFRPPGWERSAWDLAVHMVDCEWIWIYRNALRREPWARKWDPDQFPDLDHLLQFWSSIHKTTLEWLWDTPVALLNRKYPMPYPDFPFATMNWILYHVMEHEIHHRGQLFMLMRLQGLKPPEI